MRRIFYIMTMLLVSNLMLQAQEIVSKEQEKQYLADGNFQDKYFKDINGHLNKFIGTWKWQDNMSNPTKVFEATFIKLENEFTGSYFRDLLLTNFKYIENGIEIYNIENDTTGARYIFGGLFSFPNNLNKLRLFYSEPNPATNGFRYNFHIEYLPSTTMGGIPQLKWDVEVVLEVAENAELPKIPMHIILTKQ